MPRIQEIPVCMDPSQHGKFSVIRRLEPDTQSVDTALFPYCRLLLCHCARIHFHRDLRASVNIKILPEGMKNTGGAFPAQNRGGPTAQEYRTHTVLRICLSFAFDLPDKCLHIGSFLLLPGRSGQEITVGAFSHTKGYMHIQFQFFFFHHRAPVSPGMPRLNGRFGIPEPISHHPVSAHS